MSTLNSTILPLLPISNGVFFPDMVVTVEAQSPGARAAFAVATDTDAEELVVVPQSGGDYSSMGIVVHIEQEGRLPGGEAKVPFCAGCAESASAKGKQVAMASCM